MRNPNTASLAPTPAALDKKLLAYLTAIGAACAASAAVPQSAEAKVVYTPANRIISFNGKSILDLNNDHIADFVFNGWGLGTTQPRGFSLSTPIMSLQAPWVATGHLPCPQARSSVREQASPDREQPWKQPVFARVPGSTQAHG